MPSVVATTLGALVLFAAFHVPVPVGRDGRWSFSPLRGRPAMVCGIGYHLLLLPAVAALAAPHWAVAAGYAWMFLDVVLDAAVLGGSTIESRPLRDGVHVISAVWLLGAGWTAGPALGLAGTALAVAFLVRLGLGASKAPVPPALLHLNALLNGVWIVGVALTLR